MLIGSKPALREKDDASMDGLIAIVEDDDTLRGAISDLLRSCGYRTSGHRSAESFFSSENLSQIDCVVTDIQMGGMDGIDLKHRIDDQWPSLPVIMITARAEQHVLRRAAASRPFRLLRKPFEPDALIDCVARAVHVVGAAAAKPGIGAALSAQGS
jgi:FixJ family two-component response regulator